MHVDLESVKEHYFNQLIVTQLVKEFPVDMELEDSSPCSRKSAIGYYTQTVKSSLCVTFSVSKIRQF